MIPVRSAPAGEVACHVARYRIPEMGRVPKWCAKALSNPVWNSATVKITTVMALSTRIMPAVVRPATPSPGLCRVGEMHALRVH